MKGIEYKMAKKRKLRWEIKVVPHYNGEQTYLWIDLNEGLNSAIPMQSASLEDFKAEKLAEIKMFEGSNLDHIKGIELLGYKPIEHDGIEYYIGDTLIVGGMLLRHIESGVLEQVSRYKGELFIDGEKSVFPLHQFDLKDFEIVK